MNDLTIECPHCLEDITAYYEVEEGGYKVLGVSLEDGELECPLCQATLDYQKLYDLIQQHVFEGLNEAPEPDEDYSDQGRR